MKQALDQSIELLAKKVTEEIKPEEALKFTQAALNLSHVRAMYHAIELQK